MSRQPAMFVGHGSPMTMITDNPERRTMEAMGARLARPRAILAITAHWETHGETRLTGGERPGTIHDFRGFPEALYAMRYPAPGSPELAARVAGLIGDRAVIDPDHGFDHGVWGTLLPIFPDADIPVVAMSVDMSLTFAEHLAVGRRLAPLRDEGVLVLGSGNVIHNLALWRQSIGTLPEWASEFRARTNAAILSGDEAALTDFAPGDSHAAMALSSREHFIPLLYALGARQADDEVALFNDSIDGALSMTSAIWGDARALAAVQ
ncbi:4,5-DOPA dioxygenase extradiol [Altererythrobacter aerius]|uniref:4,5-DOPA dioxygenase extradiol n=1 Tax=Tsuneonella aeria TaxID=1837929 RepID=A0A6I4T9I3_9SPHN|nr:4,5-DOPA dioxygenase extradiol [Tsuneonella aeria]MXO73773.1 4,5-DOPA dioxygenase extradiol [Tsuneonella aeria]